MYPYPMSVLAPYGCSLVGAADSKAPLTENFWNCEICNANFASKPFLAGLLECNGCQANLALTADVLWNCSFTTVGTKLSAVPMESIMLMEARVAHSFVQYRGYVRQGAPAPLSDGHPCGCFKFKRSGCSARPSLRRADRGWRMPRCAATDA